ncbi:MAG: hypothetical protein Q7R95_04290 [bacterium]|nr:hypothetical protein [bacterium]
MVNEYKIPNLIEKFPRPEESEGLVHTLELGPLLSRVSLIVIGHLGETESQNMLALGKYTAKVIMSENKSAEESGRHMLFDMPTGSTPAPGYSVLHEKVIHENVHLDYLDPFGHEIEFPTQNNESGLRYKEQLEKAIRNIGLNSANYLPMLPDLRENASLEEIQIAVDIMHVRLINLLNKQESFGIYGVGLDGHGWGEAQRFHLWTDEWAKIWRSYIVPVERYSFQNGHWPLADGNGFNLTLNNALFDDKTKHTELKYLIGIGREIYVNHLKRAYHIFNTSKKAVALEHTLHAMGGKIITAKGESIEVERIRGKGNGMLDSFKNLARILIAKGIINGDKFENASNCYQIVQEIFKTKIRDFTNDELHMIWGLLDEYHGMETAVSKLTLERQGDKDTDKSTVFIISAEALRNTEFRRLALQ